MSVEALELISHEWTRWQGHVIDGLFPLGRILGCSEHSGVFLTKASDPNHPEVAIKLIPASREQEELQIPRWSRAGGLVHPNLLPLMEHGVCQLDGLPYLYVVMEHAEQTLAQLLLRRALTVEEARETLPPILEALQFLHGQDLIQGQLKPTNILVVGDQLKLASDTIRHVSDSPLSLGYPSLYDSPESRDGSSSTAADIWSLGLTLYEAAARRLPSESALYRNTIALPADFPSELREVVSSCLSSKPRNRPDPADLLAWSEGRSLDVQRPTIAPPTMPEAPELTTPTPAPLPMPAPTEPAAAAGVTQAVEPPAGVARQRSRLIAMVVAGSVLAIGWLGSRTSGPHVSSVASNAGVPAEPAPASAYAVSPADLQTSSANQPSSKNQQRGATVQPLVVHEVIPDVPRHAAQGIRGHVRISVRAGVNPDGSVSSVVPDRSNPSRYFQRLGVEAARKWLFQPAQDSAQRQMLIQFTFGRDGTMGKATPTGAPTQSPR